MANKSQEEPKTALEPDRWYNLTLGTSFKDESSNKYCTLRYEFKPASVDKTKPGLLRKTKENRISVEFKNNQIGKPKVTFEGNSEEYKENDAVLFFDGETLRLEQLHRAVKQLRHLRMPGESAGATATVVGAPSGPALDPRSSPVGKSVKPASLGRASFQAMPVEVEHIDIGEPDNTGIKSGSKRSSDDLNELPINTSPDARNEVEEQHDIDVFDIFGREPEDDNNVEEKDNTGFDMNVPHTDDDIADVDVDGSGDEVDKGPNAAEAPGAPVSADGKDEQTSTSSSSSGSGSTESGSGSEGSSSSDSEGSDDDSVHSI